MKLSESQIEFYHDQGYLLVPGVFPRAVASAFRTRTHGLMRRLRAAHNVEATWEGARAMTEQPTSLEHCHNVQFYCGAVARLLMDDRWTEAAADLIGPNIQLHHNKLFLKPAENGSPFPMHQDYPYFPHERHTMTAAIIHFEDAPAEKGCLRVVPGSHKLGPLPHEGSYHLPLEQYPLESATLCEAEAGDVLFFNYLTIHGSGINVSRDIRTTLLIQFRDPEDRPLDDSHRSRGQGMMLRGIDPSPAPQFGE